MADFWNLLVYSNVINFIILVALLAFVCVKINMAGKLSSFKDAIVEKIENSKKEKADAAKKLSDAKKYFKLLDNDINECVSKIEAGANSVVADIDEAIKKNTQKINDNTEKFLANEKSKIIRKISSAAYNNALNKAQNTISEKFSSDSGLHKKYIERSLDIFERMDL